MRFLSGMVSLFTEKRKKIDDNDLKRWAEIEFKKDSSFAFYQMKRGVFDYQDMLR